MDPAELLAKKELLKNGPPAQDIQKQNPPPTQQQPQQTQQIPDEIFQSNRTFCQLGNQREGFMEIDLKSFVEKGEETRYLSIELIGYDIPEGTKTPVQASCSMSISNEIQFNKFKEFVSNLTWK